MRQKERVDARQNKYKNSKENPKNQHLGVAWNQHPIIRKSPI